MNERVRRSRAEGFGAAIEEGLRRMGDDEEDGQRAAMERKKRKQNVVAVVPIDVKGECVIHVLRSRHGLMFAFSQICKEIFHESASASIRNLRKKRYKRKLVMDDDILARLAELRIPSESLAHAGATLLPLETVEALLVDRHRVHTTPNEAELVPILRVALLRLVSQDAASLVGQGLFEQALPHTMDAVARGKDLYYPAAPLQLVPVYLLAAQTNLGLGRQAQSEDLLGVAEWLLLKLKDDTDLSKESIQAESSRLWGQLYSLQGKYEQAYKAFSEQVEHNTVTYGVMDVRTSIGFYNLWKVCCIMGRDADSRVNADLITTIWLGVFKEIVLNMRYERMTPWGLPQWVGADYTDTPADYRATVEKLSIHEVIGMLQEISTSRANVDGVRNKGVAESCLVLGLAFIYTKSYGIAQDHLDNARCIYGSDEKEMLGVINKALDIIRQSFS